MRPTPEQLRGLIANLDAAPNQSHKPYVTGVEAFDARLPGGGLPGGSVVEIFVDPLCDAGAWRFAALLLTQLPSGRQGAVLNEPGQPALFAPAARAAGLPLERLLLLNPRTRRLGLWAIEELLRSPEIGLVVAAFRRLAMPQVRRLQLAAEESGSLLILIRPAYERGRGAGAAVRLRVRSGGRSRRGFSIETIRCRGAGRLPPVFVEVSPATGALLASAPAPQRAAGAAS